MVQAGKEFCRRLVGSDGPCVPVEHLASLVEALRDHLLACAPEAAAAGAGAGATKRQGKRKKGAVPRPLSADSQVGVYAACLPASNCCSWGWCWLPCW